MFVMCNAVDQTDLKKPAKDRMREALGHAGPAITITSLTNALAFAFGATGSLEALRSFCLFASMCIVMLYLTVLTIFQSVLTWDTLRVEKKVNECCGLCCCEETTPLCFCGKAASIKQMEYCGTEIPQEVLDKLKKEEEESDAAVRTALKASGTEKCLAKYAAPVILHKWLRFVWIGVYLIWTSIAIYGITEVAIHFEIDFFISKDSTLYDYIQVRTRYFDTGMSQTKIFVESDTIEWNDEEVQARVEALDTALEDCTGCQENWHIDGSL